MTINEPIASRRFSAERNRRIAVVGTTGFGKTALARRISRQLDVPQRGAGRALLGPSLDPDPDRDLPATHQAGVERR
jgi:ABC-type glutathione transport system ATPase component